MSNSMIFADKRVIEIETLSFITLSLCVISLCLPGHVWSYLLIPALFIIYIYRSRVKFTKNQWTILGVYILSIIFFVLFSVDLRDSIKGTYDIFRGLLLLPITVILCSLLGTSRYKWSMLMFAVAALALGRILFEHGQYLSASGGRRLFFGYFENPNNVAVSIVFSIVCTMMLIRSEGQAMLKNKSNWILFSVLTFCAVLLFLTNSRGAWLGIVAATGLLLVIHQDIKFVVKLAATIVMLVLFVCALFMFNYKGVALDSERIKIWSFLFETVSSESPIVGLGLNTAKSILSSDNVTAHPTPHNLFLELYVSGGIIGVLLFSSLLVVIFAWIFRIGKFEKNMIFYAGLWGFVAFLVMGQFDLKFASFRFHSVMAVFIGLMLSQQKVLLAANDIEQENSERYKRS